MSSSQSSPINKSSLTDKDWHSIACKIRKQNQELKEKIAQLDNIIAEQKNQLTVQVIKNQDQNQLINEQYQKIKESDIKINQKNQQYEKQKTTFDTVNTELKKTQQLAAGLERECSLLQDKYNETQHQLKQKEKENKELQTRLQRQQRYNIQLKTSLDQYLTSSSVNPSDVGSLGIESWSKDKSNYSIPVLSIDLSSDSEMQNPNQEDSGIILNNLKEQNEEKIIDDIPQKVEKFELLKESKKNKCIFYFIRK